MFRPSLHVISIIDSIKTRRSAAQKDFIETDLELWLWLMYSQDTLELKVREKANPIKPLAETSQ
jgi:hypothetical protein